jgi:hypothetical protein
VEYPRPLPDDYDAMVRLADANYVDHLTPEQGRDGFLSVRFLKALREGSLKP